MRVHTCKIAMDAVEQNGYELILQPACSPDLAPSDYIVFPIAKLEKGYMWTSFPVQRRSRAAIEEWVGDKDPGFFSSGLMALEHGWSKCIILEGSYIEKEKRSTSPRNKLGSFFIDSH